MNQRNDNLGRRQFYRLKATYLVCFRAKFTKSVFSHYQYSLTKDISVGGLLVMSEEIFPKGTEIEMVIKLPMFYEKKIQAKGVVATMVKATTQHALYPIRIKFTAVDEHAFEELKDFIDQEMLKETEGQSLRERMDRREG
ncbi:MAG: PilZ domain-containing protein [Candidatus Omnitrophica bacterium]|nr:PilZ domain-containing protein [Candidatus Omnitrophota bacterium]